ncbi:MAG TPA: tRNA preQ1(34) S-adenosylmethionine ribosyltransferase-isomerase QueA [Tepidisphaeraceae bacterium]|jgi:S-adenosylmethionine:tRNA ribosyltransferase-isomerase|nr:tRNA preQ1(34) S-adenosylmethionine ribosyltransferase-isomerase QueA [Tepidisphaeraceae bacterium]
MRTDELDFHLPPGLIAQEPPPQRSSSRLLQYRRSDRGVEHRTFLDLPRLLRPGDLLVFNNAQVMPARFTLRKESGGLIEGLFLAEEGAGHWRVLLKNIGGGVGAKLRFSGDPLIAATVLEKNAGGEYRVSIEPPESATALLARVGRMPLPPYIRRDKESDPRDELDRSRYQTIFAAIPGAIAAPTAALHFTPELFAALDDRGVHRTFVTLNVGVGTFKPVTSDMLEDHAMHVEAYTIDTEAAEALNRAKAAGRRIIAVGTTAVRVLESQPAGELFAARTSETKIFIYPPYAWKHVAAMVTNFHLPRSTLIALVAAMTGLEEQRRLYRIAIENSYRFFSYGDAMLIE